MWALWNASILPIALGRRTLVNILSIPIPPRRLTVKSNPCSGAVGVLYALSTYILASTSSTAIRSVNVPPTSTASLRMGLTSALRPWSASSFSQDSCKTCRTRFRQVRTQRFRRYRSKRRPNQKCIGCSSYDLRSSGGSYSRKKYATSPQGSELTAPCLELFKPTCSCRTTIVKHNLKLVETEGEEPEPQNATRTTSSRPGGRTRFTT